MNKKSLDKILRVSLRVATTSNESVKGWPIRFAKDGERFARSFIRIGLASLQYDCPVRRFERRTSFLQRAWNGFRNRAFSLRLLGFTIKIRVWSPRILTPNQGERPKRKHWPTQYRAHPSPGGSSRRADQDRRGLTLPCTVVAISSLGVRRGLIKFFVICSGVDIDCCSGEIEGDNIVSPSKNDSFGSAIASEL